LVRRLTAKRIARSSAAVRERGEVPRRDIGQHGRRAAQRRQQRGRTDSTADSLRTFDDYSGSPTQHTNPGWDDVTGLGTPNGLPLP
jgi:hypothetical protein